MHHIIFSACRLNRSLFSVCAKGFKFIAFQRLSFFSFFLLSFQKKFRRRLVEFALSQLLSLSPT